MSYIAAVARHPDKVETIRQNILASRSKYRSVPLEQWKFYYEAHWVITRYYNGWDVFSERAGREFRERYAWELTAPEDEQVREIDERTGVSLVASYLSFQTGRSTSFGVKLDELPLEVCEHNRESVRRRMASQARFNNLSQEERERETEAILAQLKKSRGFVEIKTVEK